jgi:plasmid maintenance system antidote protein VapI
MHRRWEPDWVVGPWEIIEETLVERGIAPSDFAVLCETTPERVSRLLAGKDRIGLKWARLLNTHLGVSEEFWLALQDGFDNRVAITRMM